MVVASFRLCKGNNDITEDAVGLVSVSTSSTTASLLSWSYLFPPVARTRFILQFIFVFELYMFIYTKPLPIGVRCEGW